MDYQIIFKQPGGPEVMEVSEMLLRDPSPSEVQIAQRAVGVNFVDTYYRSGLYPISYPSGLGNEASGVVTKVGHEVKHLKEGDRVAYATGPLGAYATARNVPGDHVVKIPDAVSFDDAAAMMLKGLTVSYLFNDIYTPKKDEYILFHASAGGVGLIACQWARHLGAKLIGTVSTDEKREVSLNFGATEAINYKKEEIVPRVKEITQGKMVNVVYDSVGKDTWITSLDCLRPMGLMISYGNASGPVNNVNLRDLATRGSLSIIRPILMDFMKPVEKLEEASAVLFELVATGVIKPQIEKQFELKDVQLAHQELFNRDRIGGVLLRP